MMLTRHPGQRAVNQRKVRRIASAIARGHLQHFTIECDSLGRVVNGQHRMLATYVAGMTPEESARMITVSQSPDTLAFALRLLACTLRAWWRS